MDTDQDAWYFGMWANPFTLEIKIYAEGDLTEISCNNTKEFRQKITEIAEFHNEFRIDATLNKIAENKFKNLALWHLCHQE